MKNLIIPIVAALLFIIAGCAQTGSGGGSFPKTDIADVLVDFKDCKANAEKPNECLKDFTSSHLRTFWN